MVQTRSQTKNQEEEEIEIYETKRQNGWLLLYTINSDYYVVTENYYTEGGDNYYEFKYKDYGCVIESYRKALDCFYDKVGID